MARQLAKVLRSQRFASRRREVRRTALRRRRRISFGVAAVALVAVAGWTLARSSLFSLEGIEVAGTEELSRTEVLSASGLKVGDNMLSLDLSVVEDRVAELPLVRNVEVTKPEPTVVRIVVTERTPAFVLETIQGFYHLDAQGVVLRSLPGFDPELPALRSLSQPFLRPGRVIRTPDVTDALSLWRALPAALRKGAARVDASALGLTLIRPELMIKFGTYDQIEQKIEAVRLLLERARLAKQRLSSIDVRSPGRPAAMPA